ncbi:N-acetylmuramoyl-L-alanine amidase [Luteolibacter yonseiensis]|uniref:N-acetylmuramoyl-L-alanine amidase n=1 Tax=Luteolibacter yonseiensis TaxID=1144680 RepID=A0A934R7V2_9BACT|nr:N-acetylmuramoyl-L-alanine amidase [Luteolibacter yonseiensis]MBK1816835.1 N-acetylmuramoyl-L-alanine amidase [Luteolibacter yonseiensis]
MKKLITSLALMALCAFSSAAQAASFRTVVIDAGHGGHDNGGQWGRVYEKHLALDTAYRLESKLKALGYQTVMTRRSDYFISLPQRVNVGNRYRNAIFVSIHYNYTWKQDVSGLETFFSNPASRPLAQYVQNSLIRRTRTVDRSAKYARFYVIRNSQIPAILVEGGFVSNTAERNRMKSGWFRESIAQGIVDGIQRYRRDG